MKKQKPHKSTAQLAKEQAEKETKSLRLCLAGLHKIGKAVKGTFVRKIKEATDCDPETAERYFVEALKDGQIRQVGTNGAGDVEFFEV